MKKARSDINFTQALTRLEQIVAKLEEPDLDLEEGLKLLEEGVKLHKFCKSKLTEANTKISTILKDESRQDIDVTEMAEEKIASF